MDQVQMGIETIDQGLGATSEMGALHGRSEYLSWLAEAHLIAGQANEGLKALAEAFAHLRKNDKRYWEAELHRARGELLLLPGGSQGEAEEFFNQALDIARSQGAKSLELRAAMSQARLSQKQGKNEEARELLGGIYGWFTEGFDTPDLVDEMALLEELT